VQIVSLDEDTSEFTSKGTFDHPYPTTKIMWIPDTVSLSCCKISMPRVASLYTRSNVSFKFTGSQFYKCVWVYNILTVFPS